MANVGTSSGGNVRIEIDASAVAELTSDIQAFSQKYQNIAKRIPFIIAGMGRKWIPSRVSEANVEHPVLPFTAIVQGWRGKRPGGIFSKQKTFVVMPTREGAMFGAPSRLAAMFSAYQDGRSRGMSQETRNRWLRIFGGKGEDVHIVPHSNEPVPKREVMETLVERLNRKFKELYSKAAEMAIKTSLKKEYKARHSEQAAKATQAVNRFRDQKMLALQNQYGKGANDAFDQWLKSEEYKAGVQNIASRYGVTFGG